MAALMTRNIALTFTFIKSRQAFNDIDSTGETRLMPALFTTMSNLLYNMKWPCWLS